MVDFRREIIYIKEHSYLIFKLNTVTTFIIKCESFIIHYKALLHFMCLFLNIRY